MEAENMIGTIVALVVALAVLCGGLYYLAKEKKDKESRKIYGIISTIGAIALIAVVIKIIVAGF